MWARRDDDVPGSGGEPGQLVLLAPAHDRGSGALFEADLDGEAVLVRRLTPPDDDRALAHAALLARQLLALDSPDLLPVRAVRTGWDHLDLVLDRPEVHSSLASFVTRRPLTEAETMSIGFGVGRALGDLHAAGLTHGRLRAADVLIRPDGSVLLTGHGVAGIAGSAGSPEGDVLDLVDLLRVLLGAASSEAMELDAAFAASDRSVAGLLDALRSGRHPATALRLPGRPPGLPVPRPTRRSWQQRLQPIRAGCGRLVPGRAFAPALTAAAGVLLLAGWIGASTPADDEAGTSARGPIATPPAATPAAPPGPAPSARAAPPPTDWRAVLGALDESRSRVLATADERALAEVDAPGSSAHASDLAVVRALRARSAVAHDVRSDPVSIEVVSAGAARADLVVVDVLRAHTILAAPGGAEAEVLERRDGRPERRLRYVLVRTDAGWRVADVRAA